MQICDTCLLCREICCRCFKNIVILNVYLPSVISVEDECRLEDLPTAMNEALDVAIASVTNPILIVGGDFNLDFDSASRSSIMLHQFRKQRTLTLCNKLLTSKSNLNYSYHHETLKQRSLIDYFLIPDSCWLSSYNILDIPFNLSDHLVIEISIHYCLNVDVTAQSTCELAPPAPTNNFMIRDWNSYSKQQFYEQSRCNFTDIAERASRMHADISESIQSKEVAGYIDAIYSDIVDALLS